LEEMHRAFQNIVRQFPEQILTLEISHLPREWIEREARALYRIVRISRHTIASNAEYQYHRHATKLLRKPLKHEARLLHLR
jgi:hypothetical protein